MVNVRIRDISHIQLTEWSSTLWEAYGERQLGKIVRSYIELMTATKLFTVYWVISDLLDPRPISKLL